MHHTVVDFETKKIEDRPAYPPEPVGVAIYEPRSRPRYMAWGHPTENNCTKRQAARALRDVWSRPLLFHNAAFDMEVACEHLGLRVPLLWDDTLILAYLRDPRAASLSLKPMAAKYLNMPPEEQDRLRDWILLNYMKPRKLRRKKEWGAYIAEAPGRLVGTYAVGDVVRTARLYQKFYPEVRDAGMLRAYDRERRVIMLKLDMERPGIRIAPRLKREAPAWRKASEEIESDIRRKLRMPATFNPGSGPQLADALIRRKKLRKIVKTENGNVSTARGVLEENCTDKNLLRLLQIHSTLSTYLGTFIEPWLRSYENKAGLIYPSYNTVRSTDEYGAGGVGTRTGRFSSSRPNFQNIPASVEESKHRDVLLAVRQLLDGHGVRFVGLRDYIVPRPGCVFIARDYDQQELRILGHYEDGELRQKYLENPKLDVHQFAREEIHRSTHLLYERKYVKETVFSIIYGKGVRKLAGALGISVEEAARLKRALLDSLPGLEWLDRELQGMAEAGKPIYTWGGRRYYAEEDRWIKVDGSYRRKRLWYKLLNLLIQGSAADATKEGMIQVSQNCDPNRFRMLVQVHDELLAEVERDFLRRESQRMREGMERLDFDVPMTTSAKVGARSWARLTEER